MGYEIYRPDGDADGAADGPVPTGQQGPRRLPPSPGPPPSRASGSGSAVATIMGVVVAAVVVIGAIGIASRSSGSDPAPDPSSYAQCAAEHDEDGSLFSDEEWCDLELVGGNGNGLADEGGDGGPVEEQSIFDDQDTSPFGP